MDQTTQTVVIDVTLNSTDATARAKEVTNQIIALKDRQDILKASGAGLSIEFANNATQLRSLQAEQKGYIALSNSQDGSITSLRAQLSILTAQWAGLSKEQRENTVAGQQLTANIKAISDKLKEQEETIGNNTRSVGDYQKALSGASGAASLFGGVVSDSVSVVSTSYNVLSGVITTLNGLQDKFKSSTAAMTAVEKLSTEASIASVAADKLSAEAKLLQTEATEAQAIADKASAEAKAIYEAALAAGATKEEAMLAAKEANIIATQADIIATEADAAAKEAGVAATEGSIAAKEANAAASLAEAEATEVATAATVAFDAVLDATGIGLIIAAVVGLVAAIATLISYFSDFAPIADVFKGIFSAIGTAIDVVFNSVVQFVGAIKSVGDLFSKLGDIISDPIGSFTKLSVSMAQAAAEAYNLKEAELQLQRQLSTQDVINAAAQQQIAALRLLARNRTLDAADREAYLKKATELEEANYAQNKKLLDEQLDLAIKTAANKKQLNADEVKDLQQKGIIEAQILLQSGRIGQEQFDAIKKADLALTQILQQRTQIDEKNQNQADQIADRAEKKREAAQKKAEEEKQRHETKLNEIQDTAQKARDQLRESSDRAAIDAIQDDRAREEAQLEQDYDKKIDQIKRNAYTELQINQEKDKSLREEMIKANQEITTLVTQTETEKQAKLTQLRQKFALEDAKTAQDRVNSVYEAEIKQAGTNYKLAHDIRAKQLADELAFELKNIQLSETAKQKLSADFLAKSAQNDNTYIADRKKAHEAYMKEELQLEQATQKAEADLQTEKIQVLKDASSFIGEIGKQNAALAKTGFLLQKAIALEEIIIQTQRKVAAIQLATELQVAGDAALGPFGLAKMITDEALGQTRVIAAIASGVIQGATIAATAISGFAKGGVYNGYGKGGYVSGPGSGTSDSINAHLSNGEAVINANSTYKYAPILSAINQAGGGRPIVPVGGQTHFASGGVYFNGISQSIQNGQISAADIANAISSQFKNIPAPVVSVQEIISAMQQQARLKSNRNF